MSRHTAALISALLAVFLSPAQRCCSWMLPGCSRRQGHVGVRPQGPTWTCRVSVSPSLYLHIDFDDLSVILMMVYYDHILVIFIQCKWKLTNCFAMIVWVLISFLMLTLLLSIGPNTSTLSVQSVLWWALTFFADSIFNQSERRTWHTHPLRVKLVIFDWKLITFLKTSTTLHCVFNDRGHIFLARKQPFLEDCKYDRALSSLVKLVDC